MLYLVPSALPNSKGGEIFLKTEYDTGFVDLTLLPESWFVPSEEYQGWYVYCKGETAKNVQIFAVGGTETTIKDFLSEYYEINPSEVDTKTSEVMFDRYERRIPPYLPRGVILDEYTGSIEEQFQQWFTEQILKTSDSRKSLHNQLKVDFNVSTKATLDEITEDFGPNRDFYESIGLPNLEDDTYWGFYLRVEDNFIPDWNIPYDHAAVFVSWMEDTGELNSDGEAILTPKISSPLPIVIKTHTEGIYNLHNEEMTKLYENYPEYFIHYEEIEEEDRY